MTDPERMDKQKRFDAGYTAWLRSLKERVRRTQLKAAVAVNRELMRFYWELGSEIIDKQENAKWGDGFLSQLSRDLTGEFHYIKGFSLRNLKYIRQWYLFYNQGVAIGQQAVAQLPGITGATSSISSTLTGKHTYSGREHSGQQLVALVTGIPWGHNIVIITKCKAVEETLFYVRRTREQNWSRSVLIHQIKSGLFHRDGNAVTNFHTTLPSPQSDLANQLLKDPYTFDFLALTDTYNERELERGLVDHLSRFLLELGAGFAYLGKQVPIRVGEREFFMDLLFYHTHLHCYVVVELKVVSFEPEHAGKLNFYLKAVDEQLRRPGDSSIIGILLCRDRDRLVAEYALSDINKPIGISEYELTQSLPEDLKRSLPSIEEIERELSDE